MHETGRRRGVDDVAGALRLEHRRKGAAPADHPEEVDVDDPLPLFHVGQLDPATRGDTGVVEKKVEAVPARLDPREGGRPVLVAAHVQAPV